MTDGRIHLYQFEDILRPRGGSMQKESLSEYLHEVLLSAFESWTDPTYIDSHSGEKTIEKLWVNLEEEVDIACMAFEDFARSTYPQRFMYEKVQ